MGNTAAELMDYPEEFVTLLSQVFDEYGLVISGWSADWDKALVKAVEDLRARRYPLYWDSRGSKGENARRILAPAQGVVVRAASADDLFIELLQRVEALERLAEPPVTTAIDVSRLKLAAATRAAMCSPSTRRGRPAQPRVRSRSTTRSIRVWTRAANTRQAPYGSTPWLCLMQYSPVMPRLRCECSRGGGSPAGVKGRCRPASVTQPHIKLSVKVAP
jgi:hypothetical protein